MLRCFCQPRRAQGIRRGDPPSFISRLPAVFALRHCRVRLPHLGFAVLLFAASTLCARAQDADEEALRHFQAAQEAQNAGSLDVAAQEYARVIRLRPDAAEAYASLGLVYNAQGKYEDSARSLEKAEKLKPGLPGVSLFLGIAYVKLHRLTSAVACLSEAVRLEPANREAHTWLSRALWDDGRTPAALEQLRKTNVLFPSDAALLLDLGEAYRKAADQGVQDVLAGAKGKPLLHQVYGDIYKDERAWEKAMAHYERALAEDAHWPGAHFGLGEVALRREKLDEAAQEYRRELQIDPSSAAALARLAEVQMLQGKADEALALFRSAIKIAPEGASNALGLPRSYPATNDELSEPAKEQLRGCVAALEEKPASAERSLALAVAHVRLSEDKDASSFPAWKEFQAAARQSNRTNLYERGVASYNRQDFRAAEVELSKWRKLHPQDMQADYLLARAYRNLSYSTLEELLAVAPDSYPAHQLLAETYEGADRNDQALAEYRIVATTAPNLPGVHFSVGHLLLKMGQQKEALSELTAELRLNPDHAEANAEVGTILLAQMEQVQAIPYLERAVQLDPDLWETRRQLGRAYYLQKDLKKAEAVLQQAIQNDPQGLAHYQLGLVYRDLGEKDAAREQFNISRKVKLDSLSQAETQMTTVESLSR